MVQAYQKCGSQEDLFMDGKLIVKRDKYCSDLSHYTWYNETGQSVYSSHRLTCESKLHFWRPPCCIFTGNVSGVMLYRHKINFKDN
jgi:hypothetical protein